MPKSKVELIRQVLEKLGAAGTGQPVASEDSDKVDLYAVAGLLNGKRIAGLRTYLDTDTMPDELALPFASIVAFYMADRFAQTQADYEVTYTVALKDMRSVIRRGEPVARQAFERMTY